MNRWKFAYPFEHEFQHRVERKKSSEFFSLKARFEPYAEHHLVKSIEFSSDNFLFRDKTVKLADIKSTGRGFLSGSVVEGIPKSLLPIVFDSMKRTLSNHAKEGWWPTIITLISAAHHKDLDERLCFHLSSVFTRHAIDKALNSKLLILFDPELQKSEE